MRLSVNAASCGRSSATDRALSGLLRSMAASMAVGTQAISRPEGCLPSTHTCIDGGDRSRSYPSVTTHLRANGLTCTRTYGFLATRKPKRKERLAKDGSAKPRQDDRQLFETPSHQLPPRNTRNELEVGPGGFTDGLDA